MIKNEDWIGMDQVESDGFDPDLICRLIQGKIDKNKDEGREWQFEVVSNDRNSFDVDKLDYLSRDFYHCGLNMGGGTQDIINFEHIL